MVPQSQQANLFDFLKAANIKERFIQHQKMNSSIQPVATRQNNTANKIQTNRKPNQSNNKTSSFQSFQLIKINQLSQQKSSIFFTQLHDKPTLQKLQNYVNNLQQKIQRALWKQQKTLQYNYMPLQQIRQKIQLQKQNYQKKINELYKKYQSQKDNQNFFQQVNQMRQFNQKLKKKNYQYQLAIQEHKTRNQVLFKQLQQKRERLKNILKGNMQLSKLLVEKKYGVQNKDDLVRLYKAKSQRKLSKLASRTYHQSSQKTITKRSSSTTMFQKSTTPKKQNDSAKLFNQCLDLLVNQIQSMRTSEDIQNGIYLEIMPQKQPKLSTQGKISHKSNIYNTLLQNYGPKVHKKLNKKYYDEGDIKISLQEFLQLNWKQIMGLVMIKDKKLEKLRGMFGGKR